MQRPRFERNKRTHSIRLTLEHLESRRLMAGLNVLVFNDTDVSRSFSSAVDTPASNRLVYVDLNRNLRFDDAEPLAVSGADGMARFTNLPAGDYLIGLANRHDSQLQTTAFASDANAAVLSTSGNVRGMLTSTDLTHAWSISSTGRLVPIGSEDAARLPMNLGGPAVSLVSAATDLPNTESGDATSVLAKSGFALVDLSPTQRVVVGLDFDTGTAKYLSVSGLPSQARITGLARMQDGLAVSYSLADQNYVAAATATVQSGTLQALELSSAATVPAGRVVSGPARNQLAIFSSANGESTIQIVRLPSDSTASAATIVSSVTLPRSVDDVSIARDGRFLFATLSGGGVEVIATAGSLTPVAQLADAAGPVTSSSRDGRFVTASTAKPNELIAWDPITWLPLGRIALPAAASGNEITSLAMDALGMRMLAGTGQGVYSAKLMNPTLQPVEVKSEGLNQVNLGVRILGNPLPLPSQVDLFAATDEDIPLVLNLPASAELKSLSSSQLIFATLSAPAMGTLEVSPSGKLVYRPLPDRFGEDSARIRVYDGLTSSIVMLSLEVRPVDDAPTAMTVDVSPISELANEGDFVGFVTVFDADADADYSISVDDSRFYVQDSQIYRSQDGQLDYESVPVVMLNVTATDNTDAKIRISRQVSIPVLDVNEGPLGITASGLKTPENVLTGYTLGTIQVDDPDGYGFYVYSVSDSRFVVNDGQLQLMPGRTVDFEGEPLIDLMVTAIDPQAKGAANFVTSRITVEVLDTNDPPTGIILSDSVATRSSRNGSIVGSITVIDQDVNDIHEVEVYDDRFRIMNHMLVINTDEPIGTAPIPVLIAARDSHGATLTQTVMVTIVNDAPFQNPSNALDVDGDGKVYPRDVLLLINMLNRKGSHTLMPQTGNGEDASGAMFPDVNGDGMLTPLDALILINHLNQRQGAASSGEGEGDGQEDGLSDGDALQVAGAPLQPAGTAQWHQAVFAPPISSPWSSLNPQEKARRDAIDAELETILDQLSLEHLR